MSPPLLVLHLQNDFKSHQNYCMPNVYLYVVVETVGAACKHGDGFGTILGHQIVHALLEGPVFLEKTLLVQGDLMSSWYNSG